MLQIHFRRMLALLGGLAWAAWFLHGAAELLSANVEYQGGPSEAWLAVTFRTRLEWIDAVRLSAVALAPLAVLITSAWGTGSDWVSPRSWRPFRILLAWVVALAAQIGALVLFRAVNPLGCGPEYPCNARYAALAWVLHALILGVLLLRFIRRRGALSSWDFGALLVVLAGGWIVVSSLVEAAHDLATSVGAYPLEAWIAAYWITAITGAALVWRWSSGRVHKGAAHLLVSAGTALGVGIMAVGDLFRAMMLLTPLLAAIAVAHRLGTSGAEPTLLGAPDGSTHP